MSKISELRLNYSKGKLSIQDTCESAVEQFKKWFEESLDSKVHEPNAFVLSTVNNANVPSSRVVLLKGVEDDGFVFYTNYKSQKSKEMYDNPNVSMCFLWHELERQVRVTGLVTKVSKDESAAYFHSRPRESQIGAWTSPQSQEIPDHNWLELKFKELELKFANTQVIPLPDHWGGWLIKPTIIEFWQGRPSRLHDRVVYTLNNEGSWLKSCLAP
jgi:pyridoxamine 5'-phosphate oxidase